jgi:hypothetical protein
VPGPDDLTTLVHELMQQQVVFGQQQAALLHLQTETVRLQRLLIERAVGVTGLDTAAAPAVGPSSFAAVEPRVPSPEASPADLRAIELVATPDPSTVTATGMALQIAQAMAPESHAADEEPEDSPLGNPPRLYLVNTTATSGKVPTSAAAAAPPATPRATRYLQPASAKATRAVTRQDVERLSRLHEAGEAAHLVLHFGEHKGNTLLQVARNDPDYVRRLALNAQRPQVRAAARKLVVAIEASEQAAQRGRMKTRKVRADGR